MSISDKKIFNGVIYDIKRFAIHDGPGIRTTVFLKGCPLGCWWCHNPESREAKIISQPDEALRKYDGLFPADYHFLGKEVTVAEIINIVLKDLLYYDESDGGVTFSGGEPFYQPEFLLSALQLSKKHGLHTTIDTSGYGRWENVKNTLPYTDLFLYDVKFIDEKNHIKYTGVSNEVILKNLLNLQKNEANVLIRIPLIPGITDTASNLQDISLFLIENNFVFPVEFLPYNIIGESKYEKLNMPLLSGQQKKQSPEEIENIISRFVEAGIDVVREKANE